MNGRPICLVDLDDTLGDFKTPMMHALSRVTGKNIHWSEYTTFDVPSLYGISYKRFLQILVREQVIEQVEIHGSSYKFLNDLHQLNYYTVLITARGWHPSGASLTEEWVANHGPDIDELIVVGPEQSKTDVIEKFKNIVFSVDDRIKHCREYTQTGKIGHVLLYNAPWNKDMSRWNPELGGYDYNERIFDLHDIITHVEWVENNGRIANVR